MGTNVEPTHLNVPTMRTIDNVNGINQPINRPQAMHYKGGNLLHTAPRTVSQVCT